jgi:uroporphyrinogen III methyltransferase/synthase
MADNKETAAPLLHRRFLIASSAKASSKLALRLENLGAGVTIIPVIAIREVRESRELQNSLARLNQYDWIIFTSSYGVDFYLQYLARSGRSIQERGNHNICAIGPATAERLTEHGIAVALIPEDYRAEGVMSALQSHYGGSDGLKGLSFLIPRAGRARNLLPRELKRAGARVDAVTCYESVLPEWTDQQRRRILQEQPDMIIFTSSSTVSNFMELSGPQEGARLLESAPVAALGPITAATAVSFGKQPEIIPPKSTIAHLIEAILEFFEIEAN